MKNIFFIIIGLFASNLLFAQTNTWIAGSGNWSTGANWSLGTAPAASNTEDIIINCACTVTYNLGADLIPNGSVDISAGSTLDLGTRKLKVGTTNNSAWLTNAGTITNSASVEVKGTATGFEQGPWLFNSGTINATKLHIGNNAGGGVFTNLSAGTVNVGTGGVHMDGTLCNEGNMFIASPGH